MSQFADPFFALFWVTRLLAWAELVHTLEMVINWRLYQDHDLLGWAWLQTKRGFLQRRGLFKQIFPFPNIMVLLVLRVVAGLWLVLWPTPTLFTVAAMATIFGTSLLLNLRHFPFSFTAAHRMGIVISGALFCYHLSSSLLVAQATLWFLAGQVCLSYTTAGVIKLKNRSWRQGGGLAQVINTPMIGSPKWAAVISQRHMSWLKGINWFTLLIQCTFFLVLMIGHPFYLIYLGWGILFHLGNGFLFGLNKFVWVWPATYPAIAYIVFRGT